MTKHKYLPVLWFFLGFGIFMFSRCSRIIPFSSNGIAIIIGPIFILAFVRTQTAKRGILLTLLGFILSFNIALWGLYGDEFLLYSIISSSLLAILYSLPYVADRLIYPKFREKGIFSTLTFPIITTAISFLSSLEGPFDGTAYFGVFAYGILSFKQIASIAGLWGFVFVFSWLASIMNYGWENKFEWTKIKKITLIFLSILVAIVLFGTIKTSLSDDSDTVKIASIILLPEEGKAIDPESLFSKEPSPYDETISKIENLAKIAAINNAKIVTFQETSMKIGEENEAKLKEQIKRIAEEKNIYFSVSYGVFPEKGKGWNKHLLVNNKGEIEIDYKKRYLKGFGNIGETRLYKKGPEVIQTADTPYGRIGASICRDMEFPPYIRQAGKKRVDIMLNPSYDLPKSTGPCNPLRAIENGFSLVRPVYNGYSYAMDYNGRVLAHMDSDQTEDGIMYADVPTRGVRTIYSTIGNLFAWLCVLGFLGFIVVAIRKAKL